MQTAENEIKRLVLIHLLNKYPPGFPLEDKHFEVAYKLLRTKALLDTLEFKYEHGFQPQSR